MVIFCSPAAAVGEAAGEVMVSLRRRGKGEPLVRVLVRMIEIDLLREGVDERA